MLKLGDEVSILSPATYSDDKRHDHIGKTSMVTRITASKDGTLMYGLKGIALDTHIWSESDLQPTGRKLLESSIGKNTIMPGEMAVIDIDGEPQERRVYSLHAEYDIFGTLIGLYYILWNSRETTQFAYIRSSREVKPTNTYTLF